MRYSAVLLLLAACATLPKTDAEKKPAAPPPSAGLTPPAPTRAWKQARPIVIRHATVLPASGPAIEDGAVAFADGKLVAVGKNAEVATPPGAEELDGTGLYVTPGIIDAHSHLGVYAAPATFSNDDGNEITDPVTAEVQAEHSFWPQDPALRRAAAAGVTAQLVLPGSANLIGGRGFPIKVQFGRTAAEVRFPGAMPALKMACGENPRRVYGAMKGRAPYTRMANVAGFRKAFQKAIEYRRAQAEYARRKAETEAKEKAGEKKQGPEQLGPPPPRDLQAETLVEVLEGRIFVQNHCYRADEMAVMLELAKEFGFKIRAFHHALESYKVRDLLAANEVASATWADWWGFKMEARDGIPENAGLLTRAGARAIIHSDSPIGGQRLNQEAAKALFRAREAGLPLSDEEALRWITLNPAWLMGVDQITGSLEKGKMADVVLWAGHPFSAYARARRVWVDGVETFDWDKGPAEVSDFELEGQGALVQRSTAKPQPPPQLQGAPCSDEKTCPALLPVEAAACTAFIGVTLANEGQLTPNATVVVEGGKISRLAGPAPAGCRQLEGKGRVLSPGFVQLNSGLGLNEVPAEESTVDRGPRRETPRRPAQPALKMADSFNPRTPQLAVGRQGGVTTLELSPDGNLISGQSAQVGIDGSIRRSSVALHVNLGNEGRDAVQFSRAAVLKRLRELLFDAREFGLRREAFDQNRMRDLAISRLDLEALQPVLAGTLPVVFHANRETDLRAALALSKEFGLKPVLVSAAEGWTMARELAEAKVPVVVYPTLNLPSSFEALYSRADNAALLEAAGVKVAIAGDEDADYRLATLRQSAANAVAYGLSWAAAHRSITSHAADALGLEAGRLKPGAPADLVLWTGDPLELTSRAVGMWVGGQQLSLESRQDALFEKYKQLPPKAR